MPITYHPQTDLLQLLRHPADTLEGSISPITWILVRMNGVLDIAYILICNIVEPGCLDPSCYGRCSINVSTCSPPVFGTHVSKRSFLVSSQSLSTRPSLLQVLQSNSFLTPSTAANGEAHGP